MVNVQCSTYTCGTGYTADAGKQSTACSSGTCTDSFCCEPQVRKHHAHGGDIRICCHSSLSPGGHWQEQPRDTYIIVTCCSATQWPCALPVP
jgi:hypothetical protein